MSEHQMRFYPVGNGDTTLITLADGVNILIDCCIRQACKDDDDEAYDVIADLLDRLPRDDDGRPYVDVFILTHPHADHCLGLDTFFWLGDLAQYPSDDDEEKIVIGELWFAPRIFNDPDELPEDAKAFRKDAERRVQLWRSDPSAANAAGDRVRVIGYSDDLDLDGLDDVLTIPGNFVDVFNGTASDCFRFFVLAPIKDDTDDEWTDRNDTSIVLRAEFGFAGSRASAYAYLGGDAGCAVWERIWEKNKGDAPEWDLLLAPHHCSWKFFSDSKYEEDPTPSDKVMEFLNHSAVQAKAVASCKAIEDDDDDPPHYAAAKLYKQVVGDSSFLCTDDDDPPQPIVLRVTTSGVQGVAGRHTPGTTGRDGAAGTPSTYG